ncbi:MAG TPA: YdcF family protein [Symbiobacteriaceae bacterium]
MVRKTWVRVALLGVTAAVATYVITQAAAILDVVEQGPVVVRGSTALVLGDHLEQGHPGLHFRQRLDRAAELYRRGQVSGIIISGGGTPPEAAAGRRYLLEQGISPDVILPEERSCSTRLNIRFSTALLRQRGLEGPVVIITNGFHLRRALLLAGQEGLQAVGMPAEETLPPFSVIWSSVVREVVATTVMRVWDSPPSC